VILSNFRKTRTKDRIESYRIVSYCIFFKNIEKETANQTFELFSNKKKKIKNFGIKTDLFKQILQSNDTIRSYTIRYDIWYEFF